MIYFLILTNKCNLRCKYCFEKAFDDFDINFPEDIEELDNDVKFNTKQLKQLIVKDKKPYFIFYGGEPTLRLDLIKKIIDDLPKKTKYIIQTNGLLLKYLPHKYWDSFESVFISIDGNKKITNENRGKETYEKIIDNIICIRKAGYKKEITARMTVLNSNIYKEVKHLLNTRLFDSVHWQIDANFWFNDYKKRNFKNWLNEDYKPNLKKLVEFWFKEIKKGKVLKLYPFIGIMHNILHNKKTKLACGAGYGNFAIQTNAKIIPCPIMAGMKNYYLGDISKKAIKPKAFYLLPEWCKSCKYLNLCGSRCLYSNIVKPWPKEQRELVCESTNYLIDLL
jgi:putative peptide-modifying radical SAM enzyme